MNKNINICMVAYTFYETDGRVRKYAESLTRKGDNVDVISLRKKGQRSHEILNGVNIYQIQKRSVDEKNKFTYAIKLLTFFINSSLFLTMRHLKNPYDIIHVHSVPDFQVFVTLIPKLMGAKVILDIHDPVPDFFIAKFGYSKNNILINILKFIEYTSAKFADHLITVTDHWKNVISDRSRIPNEKMSVILNLPDTKMFNYERFSKIKKSETNFILLYPGTLNKHCGIDIVIKAIDLIKTEIPSIKFIIYGKGSELANLQSMVKSRQLEKFIFFHDQVPWQSIPELMHKADLGIALLSGHNEYSNYALNVKLFEFLSMGIPVIATRTSSTEEYLNEDVVIFSEPNNHEDVAKCIKEIYNSHDRKKELIRNGLEYIKRNNWQSQMFNYFDIIKKVRDEG